MGQLLTEHIPVLQIADPKADPGILVRIAGTDAALGGADLPGIVPGFLQTVQLHMIRHQQMSPVTDIDMIHRYTLAGQCIHFLQQNKGVHYHTRSDNALGLGVQHARRKQVQHILLAARYNGMACVVSALEPDNAVRLLAQYIYNFTLTFVAPLGAYYNISSHCCSSLF